jgi:hypothetical protein
MTTLPNFEYTRPGAHSAKNARQAGAPNHLQGSGETLMVGNSPNPRTGSNGPLVTWVFERINPESHRFLSVDDHGRFTISLDRLAVLVAEIVIEHTADLNSRLDAAEGVIGQLEDDLRAAQGGVV